MHLKELGMQTSMLVNLQRLDTHGKPHPWLFVRNRITRYLAYCMVMSLAAAAQESHDFNRGRCQKLYGRPIQDVSRYEKVINGLD